MRSHLIHLCLFLILLLPLGCRRPPMGTIPPGSWDHVVIVWEENQDAQDVENLPYFRELRERGRYFTHSYGLVRPSQPNYIALFSGTTHGVTTNDDHQLDGANLQSRLAETSRAFVAYAEGLPSVGWRGSTSGRYVRKHNPAASFTNVPDAAIQPFSALPRDFSTLPQISFVIPNLDHDMHDGTPAMADTWLRANLDAYASWAVTHRSLLIVTFDEPHAGKGMRTPIYTVFVGDGIPPGSKSDTPIDHYSLLGCLTESFHLAPLAPVRPTP